MVEVRTQCPRCEKKYVVTGPEWAANKAVDEWQKNHECTQIEYVGSEAYKCVMAATPEQLRRRRPYTLAAIELHEERGNKAAEDFFRQDLALIDKRIGKV